MSDDLDFGYEFDIHLKESVTDDQFDYLAENEPENGIFILEDGPVTGTRLIVWAGSKDEGYIDCVLQYINLTLEAGCHPVRVSKPGAGHRLG